MKRVLHIAFVFSVIVVLFLIFKQRNKNKLLEYELSSTRNKIQNIDTLKRYPKIDTTGYRPKTNKIKKNRPTKQNRKDQFEEEIIGTWYDDAWGTAIVVYKQNGRYYKDISDGTGRVGQDLLQRKVVNGKEYLVFVDNDFGEYLRIDERGNLEYYDESGLIFIAQKLNDFQVPNRR